MEFKLDHQRYFPLVWGLGVPTRQQQRRRRRKLIYIALVSTLFILLLLAKIREINRSLEISSADAKKLEDVELQESIQLEKGTECVMPELNPFAEEVMRFDRKVLKPELVCEGADWVECYFSKCYVVRDLLEKSGDDVECEYQDILHVDDTEYYMGPPVKLHGRQVYNLNRSDHIQVICHGKVVDGSNSYRRIPIRWIENKAGFRPVVPKIPRPGRQESPDVLIVAFDSASRNGFIRRMPKSYRFLKEELKAVVFKGFNILGDGTPASIIPLLTGMSVLEFTGPNTKRLKDNFFDKKLLIFHAVGEDGYRTAFFEDMPFIGTFQYRFAGFKEQPADHYLRSLLLEDTYHEKKWNDLSRGRYCMGAVPKYAWMLNLTSQFFKLDGKHFCFTFISDISHDDFNFITTADVGLVNFLRGFRDEGRIKNTLLIVMGDHGVRFDYGIRNTYQGTLEERLPFLSIVLPKKLIRDRSNVMRSLKANVDVLTTPFDVHATLLDAVGLREHWSNYQVPGASLPRAMTLLEPIPKSRTCGKAGITTHWCVCAKWHKVSRFEAIYERVGRALAAHINKLTYHRRHQCERRKLTSIDWVRRRESNKFSNTIEDGSTIATQTYYQAKIEMAPGMAVFEGSMVYDTKTNAFRISELDISRTSPYGEESNCAPIYLSKFCFCKQII